MTVLATIAILTMVLAVVLPLSYSRGWGYRSSVVLLIVIGILFLLYWANWSPWIYTSRPEQVPEWKK